VQTAKTAIAVANYKTARKIAALQQHTWSEMTPDELSMTSCRHVVGKQLVNKEQGKMRKCGGRS